MSTELWRGWPRYGIPNNPATGLPFLACLSGRRWGLGTVEGAGNNVLASKCVSSFGAHHENSLLLDRKFGSSGLDTKRKRVNGSKMLLMRSLRFYSSL